MSIVRATVRLHKNTGEPIDDVINVWHFLTFEPIDAGQATSIFSSLDAFYSGIYSRYSAAMARGVLAANTIALSQLTEGGPGADDDVTTAALYEFNGPGVAWPSAGATSNYPSEVACCLSFAGDLEGVPEETGMTRPASRRRGRVYLGPLNVMCNQDAALNTEPRVDAATRLLILTSYQAMIDVLQGLPSSIFHVVYSPTSGNTYTVKTAFVDDAFDTIRSRGVVSAVRSGVPIVQTL